MTFRRSAFLIGLSVVVFGGAGLSWGATGDLATTAGMDMFEAKGFRTQMVGHGRGVSFGESYFDPAGTCLYYTGMQGESFVVLQCPLSADRPSVRARSASYLSRPASPLGGSVFFLSEEMEPLYPQVTESPSVQEKENKLRTAWLSHIHDYCVDTTRPVAVIAAAGPLDRALWVRGRSGEWLLLDTERRGYRVSYLNSRCVSNGGVVYWTMAWDQEGSRTMAANRLCLDSLTTSTFKSVPLADRDLYEPTLAPSGELWAISGRQLIRIAKSGDESVVYSSQRYLGNLAVGSRHVAFFEADEDPVGDGHGRVVVVDPATNAVIKRLPTKLPDGPAAQDATE